jgi:hypothetical protein
VEIVKTRLKAASLSVLALPALFLLPNGVADLKEVAFAMAGVLVVFAVLASVLALCGIAVRVEWGKVKKIRFERLPSRSGR